MPRAGIILLLGVVFLGTAFISPALADAVLMKSGTVLECLIREETGESYRVWVVTESGIESEYEIPKADVKEVEKRPYWGEEYRKLNSATDFQSEDSVRALAEWCKKQGLEALSGKFLVEAEKLRNRDILKKYPEVACEPCSAKGELTCEACAGKGFTVEKCEKCKGVGRVKCEKCKGEGWVKCPKCSGKGKITVKKKVTGGSSGGSKSAQQTCPKCKGNGKLRCKDCLSKGNVKCVECKGSGTQKITCKECSGQPVTVCETCSGTGIDPVKYKALLERLEREKAPPPVVVKKDPVVKEDPEEIARKKLLARTRYVNNYHVTGEGEVTEDFLGEKILLYPALPAKKGDWPVLKDNTKILIFEDELEPVDGINGKYYHVRVEDDGAEGYINARYLRTEKFEFITCAPCEGKGDFECPACHGEAKIIINKKKEFQCKVCDGSGRITCVHCGGSGKLRKK